ncbi:DUF6531 domain-containing protein [Methylomonas sp. SURF-2]|uniref:DUF6531 domain-containing protein n=1 Tax=Methylomonas subterranea TaxID=2952225 RepID=A0ABT1TI73_9GAMM|nr:RHS repeat-associated core domain-containing protein [Methylomonas sp. SURF-2]MCQ8105009.1 DUF6531 domain-containing protein [Methylomonas sp. SURF-2]
MQNNTSQATSLLSIAAILVVVTLGALTWHYVDKQAALSEAPLAKTESVVSPHAKPAPPRADAAMLDFDTVAETMAATYIGDGRPSEADSWSEGIANGHHATQQLLDEPSATSNLSPRTERLRQKRDGFRDYRYQIDDWLANQGLDDSALAEQVRDRFDRLDTAFGQVLDAKTDGDRQRAEANLQNLLQQLQPPRVSVPTKPQPTFTLQEATTLTPDDTPNAPLAAEPEATACGYQTADLDDAMPEIKLNDPQILALAERLHYSPTEIYQYVKNQIEFQPYFGSLKGAATALVSGSGNATDQASLLIALLRASKIPARYVYGEVRFPSNDPRLLDWLGVKADEGARARLLNGQIPVTKYIDNNGNVTANAFTHVWVEACVPYGNYRGSRNDDSGFHWIPLDASFKETSHADGTTVADVANFSFDYNAYLSKRTTVMPQEALRDQMEALLGKTLAHGGGYRSTIVQKNIDVLPSTLPYEVVNFKDWESGQAETAALPDSHRYFAEITAKNSAGSITLAPSLKLPMAELAAGRLTLSFTQTNTANTAAGKVATWQSGTSMVVPCASGSTYLQTQVRPVFKQEGTDITPIGTYNSVGFCSRNNRLALRLSLNNKTVNQVEYYNIGAHNYHALQLYAFQASNAMLETRSAKLLAAVGSNANPNAQIDATLGEYLHIAGLKYMGYITEAGKTVGKLYGETGDSGHHIGLTSTAMKVEYVFDLPFAVSRKGLLVDVPGGSFRSRNVATGSSNYDSYLLAGYSGSAYESYIWQEQAHVDAVSTVRGLQYARDTGLPVVVLSKSADVDTLLNVGCATSPYNLNYSATVKQNLKDLFINQGYFQVTLPRCLINYDGWAGAVWIAEKASLDGQRNLLSAETSYTISGQYLTAQGGYSLSTPISNTYSSWLNTGYQGVFKPATTNFLTVGSVTNSNLKLNLVNSYGGINTGNVATNSSFGGDPVNLVSGNLYHPERDFTIKGRGGLDLVFERTYNSNVRKDGPLGYGWTHSFNHQLQFFDEDANGKVDTAIWIDGTGAANKLTVAGTAAGVPVNTNLTPQAGLRVSAKREANGEYSLKEKSGLTFFFQNVAGTARQTANLTRVLDRNGNTLTFVYSAGNLFTATDGIGRSLHFWYDNGGSHITRITDWAGRTYRYTYDSRGDLVKYESSEMVAGSRAGSTSYAYYQAADGTNLDHALKAYTRPNGNAMQFEYYANGKTFRHTDSQGHSYTFRYNKFRRETTTVDERGVSQTHLFNEYGQPLQQWQGDGSRLVYEYQDTANPLSETRRRDALGHAVQYSYDAIGNVTVMTQPDGSTVTYQDYNAFNLPTKIKDVNGNVTLYRYDANGNRTETIALKPGVHTTTPTASQIAAWTIQSYDANGNLTRATRVKDFATKTGPYIEYHYDAQGLNPVSVKRCGLQQLGGALAQQCSSANQVFDNLGRPTTAVDTRFYPAETRYNADDQITRATDAIGQWRDFAYDNNGNAIGASLAGFDAQGNYRLLQQQVAEYDSLDRPVVQRDSAGHATRTAYDETGNAVKITNPDGYSIRFERDAVGRPTRAFDAQGNAVTTEYDLAGRPVKTTDPNGLVSQYAYYDKTGNGRLRRLTSPDGRYTDYFYDANGNVIRSVDNGGRETLTQYDALNRPVKTVGPVHDALGLTGIRQVTETQYTALGDLQTVRAGYRAADGTETLSTQASYVYDDFGRVIEQSDALGHVTRWVYDGHGLPVRRESANGHIVEWTYDHARGGLLTRQTARLKDTDPAPHVTDYSYDALGQLTHVDAPEVSYDYTYDNAQRLATATDNRGNKTLTYRHSPGGLLDSLEDNEGWRQDFLYDAVGRLSAIQAPGGAQANFIFDAGGRLRETTMPNGYRSLYRYSAGGDLEELVNRAAGGAEVSRHSYGYDTLGRRNRHLEVIAGTSTDYRYQYDTLDRLREVRSQNDTASTLLEAYQYDAYGNRRQRTAQDGSVRRYLYDATQQLTQVRSGSDTGGILTGYSYDEVGNQILQLSADFLILDYDALDRLALVRTIGTSIATEHYRYDHQDRRIETLTGGTPKRFVYAGQTLLSEYGADWNSAQAHYAYAGLDRPLIRTTPGDTAYYHADGLGSIVATSNAAGAITASARYDAFGQTIGKTGTIPRYGYAGREPDKSGLIYYRARTYDPGLGRFAQRDPAGFADGINPYAYVGNNPISFSDPLGLMKAVPSMVAVPSYPGSGSVMARLGNIGSEFMTTARETLRVPGVAVSMAPAAVVGDSVAAVLAGGIKAYNSASNYAAKGVGEIENAVLGRMRTGSATKTDSLHSFPNMVDNFVGDATKFSIPTKGPGGLVIRQSELYQVEGGLNSKQGVFEWIVDQGQVTHRRFIPNGQVTGFPNQIPPKP